MVHRQDHQLLIVVLTFAICFQIGAANRRAEENVCCETKWNTSDIHGGCCGQGWGVHCCYSSIIPQTRQEKTLFIRTKTCCYGAERVPAEKLHNQLYKGIVWLNAIVLATTVVLTALLLFGCCRSFCGLCGSSGVYPVKQIIYSQPARYGAVLETWPNGRYSMTDGFGFSAYPGGAQPAHPVPYTQIDYPLRPSTFLQPQKQAAASPIKKV